MRKILIISIIQLLILGPLYSQNENQQDTAQISSELDSSYNFLLRQLETRDIGFLWSGEISQSNRLGYIGEDFQRLEIQFISVIQNYDNPYEYFLYGKSKVENTVCDFQGSLQITETGLLEEMNGPDLTRAYISGDYVLFEDQSCLHAGVFRGNFITGIYLDESGEIFYDDIDIDENDYINNEFFGDWEKYFSPETRPANWGDFRIPYSADLDVGLEKFKPAFKYLNNGWQEFQEQR